MDISPEFTKSDRSDRSGRLKSDMELRHGAGQVDFGVETDSTFWDFWLEKCQDQGGNHVQSYDPCNVAGMMWIYVDYRMN